MNLRTITTLVASVFLMTVLQLVAGLINVWAALACGVLIVPAAFGIDRFFEADIASVWLEIGAPVISSAIGVAIAYFTASPDPRLWFAPLAAAAVASIVKLIQNRSSKRCALCNRRIGRSVAFTCPRCGLLACEQNCWVFDHGRCRLCEQNRVTVFTPDGRWWDRQFGPRSPHGRCQLCMTPAEETDLRVCGKCGRPQCRECWDFSNGQCSRCQWTVEDLPEALREFVITPAHVERSGRR
jgi:hypothetical protein